MFYLSGNPFVCNCHLAWFKHINTRVSRFPQVMDMDRIECSVTSVANMTSAASTEVIKKPTGKAGGGVTKYLGQLADSAFLCPYETHCLPQCMCCDFFACDCQMKCPPGCACFHDQTWGANIIQCSGGGHTKLPSVIPMDTTALYLDGNNLTELKSGFLLGRNRLKKLSIRSSGVARIGNQSFVGLGDLQELDLSSNQLKTLEGHEFAGLSSLRELYLQHNQLVSISSGAFKSLKYLTVLQLDGNLLIAYPIWELSSNPNLSRLTLANNWWQCECDFVRKFRMFIDGNLGIIPDAKVITCTSTETSLAALNECSGILGSGSFGSHFKGPWDSDALPMAVGLCAVGLIVLALTVAGWRARETCLIWLHAKHGIRISKNTQSAAKWDLDANADDSDDPEAETKKREENLFDSLVLYSLKDDKLVSDELVKQLEPSYRLCVHHRDLSGIYTSEAFKSAMKASSRHVVVMSQGFLASEWDYVKNDAMLTNVVIVQLDDFGPEDVAGREDVKAFFKAAKHVLKWKDPWFWRKLRFYLPDPTKPVSRAAGAELDTSGVWTYTSLDAGINESGASTSKLISTPGQLSTATSVPALAMLSCRDGGFPRKQPHQCSTHYLSGAPSSPSTRYAGHLSQQPPQTRSCGTNAVAHQRSSSAVVAQAKSISAHGRSKSTIAPQLANQTNPPTPPPKLTKRNSVYNVYQSNANLPPLNQNVYQSNGQLQNQNVYQTNENIYGGSSFLQQLVSSSQDPEILSQLPGLRRSNEPTNYPQRQSPIGASNVPPPPPCTGHYQSPHVRSSSMIDQVKQGQGQGQKGSPVASPGVTRGGYTKHGRSVSTLAPVTYISATPRQIHQRSSSGVGVTRTASMLVAPSDSPAKRALYHKSASNLLQNRDSQGNSPAKRRHHRSVSHLDPSATGANLSLHPISLISNGEARSNGNLHNRSFSSPHEGFVL